MLSVIELRIKQLQEFVDAPPQDWVNQHDYSSGYYYGMRVVSRSQLELLKEIKDHINEQAKASNRPRTG